jgi:hypothetical protein
VGLRPRLPVALTSHKVFIREQEMFAGNRSNDAEGG